MTSSAIIRQGVHYETIHKNTLDILTIALAASAAAVDEIEQFISETMAERRAQNAREAVNTEAKSEIQQIVLPESKLSAKTKSLKSRSYKYDNAKSVDSIRGHRHYNGNNIRIGKRKCFFL